MSGSDVLSGVLGSAPELNTAPELALASANAQDPNGTAQALAHTVNTNAQDKAVANVAKKVGHPNLLHQTLSFFGGAISHTNDALREIPGVGTAEDTAATLGEGAMHLANAGLSEVQHTYRALHDIEARHGPVVGLLEALGIAAGAAGAAFLAPETGGGSLLAFGAGTAAILGGEATADVASRVLYKDSWDRTQNGEAYQGIYNRQTGQYSGGPVSLGRDLADHLPHPLRFMSGITDGLADLTLDPLAVVGGGIADVRKAALSINTATDLDRALANPLIGKSLDRAFGEIAGLDGASVAIKYPKFNAIAGDLGQLDSKDAVIDYFRNSLGTAEFLDKFPGQVPTLPLTRIPFRAANDFIRTYDGPGSAALRVFQLLPTDFNPELLKYSGKDFDPSGQGWSTGVYRALRFGQSDEVARGVVDSMLATSDLGVRRDIYKNAIAQMFQARGISTDNEFYRNMMQGFENTTPLEGGPEAIFSANAKGENLSKIPDGNGGVRAVATLENQTGRWAFPDYMEMQRAIRAQGNITDLLGGADDAFYHHFTQAVFKRAALLTGGFALRIAAAEALPAAFREGFTNLVRNSLALHVGAQAAVDPEEVGHIAAVVQRLTGGLAKAARVNPDDIDLYTRAVWDNGGHMVAKGLDADAHGAAGISFLDTPEGNATTLLQRVFKRVPPKAQLGDEFGTFGGGGVQHVDAWSRALTEAGNSELATTAADALHTELSRGTNPILYHGSGSVEGAPRAISSNGNLGPGFYLTDTPSVANEHAIGESAGVMRLQAQGAPLRMLDLDSALPSEVERLVNDLVPEADRLGGLDASGTLRTLLRGRYDVPPAEVVQRLQDLGYEGVHTVEHRAVSAGTESVVWDTSRLGTPIPGKSLDDATLAAASKVREVLDSKSPQWLGKFERNFTPSIPGNDPLDDWSRVVVEHVKGLVGHPYDDSIKMDVLHDLSMGEASPVATLKSFAPADMPIVKGRIEMPPTFEGPIARVAQVGYTHAIDPMINFLSREPIYATELKKQYEPLKALIGEGILGEDEALRIAQIRTVKEVTPFIHNPLERSQFSQLARNFMPFYFAQTQAYRRVGRLLADDPGAFRKFQLMSTALHEVGTVTTDENGQPQFVYPGSGFLAHTALGALGMGGFQVAGSTPVSFSGDVRSLQTIFPFNEEGGGIGVGPFQARFGPLVSIPLHALETMFPEIGQPLANRVLGPVGASGGLLDQFLPNTPLRNTLKAAGLWPGGQRELTNAMVQTMQSLSYQQNQAMDEWVKAGHQPDDPGHPAIVPTAADSPMVRQQFIDRVRNQSRVLLFLKAAISTIAPAAPAVSASDLGLQKELRDLIASKGPDGKPIGIGGAITEFLQKHPDATPYTVFGSQSNAGGFLPSNRAAQDFLDSHMDLLKKYPYAGAWLIPQTSDPYDQSVYNEQLALGLRQKKAPDQVLNDIYISQGNNQFYTVDYPAHLKALAAVQGDTEATKAENTNFNTYLSTVLGPQNPVWWDDFQSKDRQHERTNALGQLRDLFAKGEAPPGAQSAAVKSLLDDYDQHLNAMQVGQQDGWTAEERQHELDNWKAYIDKLAKENPLVAPLALKVFRSLDSSASLGVLASV